MASFGPPWIPVSACACIGALLAGLYASTQFWAELRNAYVRFNICRMFNFILYTWKECSFQSLIYIRTMMKERPSFFFFMHLDLKNICTYCYMLSLFVSCTYRIHLLLDSLDKTCKNCAGIQLSKRNSRPWRELVG